MSTNIHLYDYLVVAIYLIGIFFLAYRSSRQKNSSNLLEDQYLAGKSLTIPESLCSIIATEVSALTFLGIPAFAFGKDFSFIQIYMGAIIGRILIAQIMLPLVYDKGITIFSAMGKRGDESGQRAIAVFYSINKFLAVGVRLFSGSILVAEFFNLSIYAAVGIICVITFFYTLIGGLKAVVRTDMVQMFLFIFGGLVAHYLIPQVANQSWSELMSVATSAGKTSFFDFSNPMPFVIGVFGGILFDMATHGVDQDFVQRLTANKTMKGAQFSIMVSSFVSIAVGLLFLGIGALLWSYYQINPMPEITNDKIFAHFITAHFPIGVKGLMVAGVLAATMSTLDSSINALSSCLYNDIFHHRAIEEKKISKYYLKDTLIITIIFMAIAFIASKSDGLLLFGLKITSWTAGSLLAVFFATLVLKISKLTVSNVLGAYILGIIGVYLNTYHLKWNWNFNVYLGFGASLLFLYLKNYSKLKEVSK
jgi:SSS family transporter